MTPTAVINIKLSISGGATDIASIAAARGPGIINDYMGVDFLARSRAIRPICMARWRAPDMSELSGCAKDIASIAGHLATQIIAGTPLTLAGYVRELSR